MQYRNNIELSPPEKIRCHFSGSKAVIKLGIDVRWDLYVFCQIRSVRLKGESFLRKTFASLSRQQTATSNRRFEFRKCR